jgi:hypothetical protein
MAYNYFPQTYQSPVYYPPQSNGYQGNSFQNGTSSQQNNFIQWVQGENAAKSFPIAPNTSVPLFDSEANCIYIKSADASGMPSIKILDYTVRGDAPKMAGIQAQSDFVTHDELAAISKEIDALKAKFERTAEKRNGGKSDGK